MMGKSSGKGAKPDDDARAAETAKTARLRALRLAKEAADKDVADREAAAKASRAKPRRRVHAATPPTPGEAVG